MSFTDNIPRFAGCLNVADCSVARAGNAIEWYRGAGEYCPECGEALVPRDAQTPPPADDTAIAPAELSRPASPVPPTHPALRLKKRAPAARVPSRRRAWTFAGVILVAAAIAGYAGQRMMATQLGNAGLISVCPAPVARGLAADLVRAYAAKSGIPQNRFEIVDVRDCDVRFSTAAATPQAVIATDGIVAIVNPLNPLARVSENELRAIFSGTIKDWSQLGEAPGAIVPILPDAGSDEAKALTTYGFSIGPGVIRDGTSADVTRAVTGADRRSRAAIGLVTFSAAVPGKVVPLAYLPPPSVLSIASHRYPFTMTIAIGSDTDRSDAATAGLIDFARSRDGAAVVEQNGLIPHETQ